MILWILISLLVLLILWILLVPVIIYLDTARNRYLLILPGMFRAAVVPSEELFHIRGRIFLVPFTVHPFQRKPEKKLEKPAKKPAKKRKKVKISGGLKLAINLLQAIRIRKLLLDIDTDDFMLNARLIPVFSMVNSEYIRLRANFTGTLSLLLDMRIRMGTLLWIFILHKIKSFY